MDAYERSSLKVRTAKWPVLRNLIYRLDQLRRSITVINCERNPISWTVILLIKIHCGFIMMNRRWWIIRKLSERCSHLIAAILYESTNRKVLIPSLNNRIAIGFLRIFGSLPFQTRASWFLKYLQSFSYGERTKNRLSYQSYLFRLNEQQLVNFYIPSCSMWL